MGVSHMQILPIHWHIRGATQNFQESEYTAQTISAMNLRC